MTAVSLALFRVRLGKIISSLTISTFSGGVSIITNPLFVKSGSSLIALGSGDLATVAAGGVC